MNDGKKKKQREKAKNEEARQNSGHLRSHFNSEQGFKFVESTNRTIHTEFQENLSLSTSRF